VALLLCRARRIRFLTGSGASLSDGALTAIDRHRPIRLETNTWIEVPTLATRGDGASVAEAAAGSRCSQRQPDTWRRRWWLVWSLQRGGRSMPTSSGSTMTAVIGAKGVRGDCCLVLSHGRQSRRSAEIRPASAALAAPRGPTLHTCQRLRWRRPEGSGREVPDRIGASGGTYRAGRSTSRSGAAQDSLAWSGWAGRRQLLQFSVFRLPVPAVEDRAEQITRRSTYPATQQIPRLRQRIASTEQRLQPQARPPHPERMVGRRTTGRLFGDGGMGGGGSTGATYVTRWSRRTICGNPGARRRRAADRRREQVAPEAMACDGICCGDDCYRRDCSDPLCGRYAHLLAGRSCAGCESYGHTIPRLRSLMA
jgi:hypothetical protein